MPELGREALSDLFPTGATITEANLDSVIESVYNWADDGPVLHPSDFRVTSAVYTPYSDSRLAGLTLEHISTGNVHVLRGGGALAEPFSPDVNMWYKMADQETLPILAHYQGLTAVVQGTWLSPNLTSTLLWTPVYVKYDATGIYLQTQSAPVGSWVAFEIVLILDTIGS